MAPVGFLCARGSQLCLQIPLLIPGCLYPAEAPAGCQEGILGCFLWRPGWLTRARQELSCLRALRVGRQGSGDADGTDISRVAPAGLAEPSILCRHPAVSFPRGFQNPSAHPTGCVSAPSWLRLPSLQDRTEEEASCAQNPTGTGTRCAAVNALRGWQGLQIPACCCLPRLLLLLLVRRTWPGAGRDAAGGIGAGIRGACPGGAGESAPAAPLQVKPYEKCRSTPCCAARTGKGQGRPAVPPGG